LILVVQLGGRRRQRGQPTYVLKYRVFGRQRFFTIGPHGSPWTPEMARKEAKRLLGLAEYLSHAKKKQRPRTYSEIERYLLVAWKPLHPVSVFKITRRQIAARVSDIANDQGAVSAARARTSLSAMLNWAIREGLDIPANPVLGTNRPAEPKSRERVLTDPELRAVWRACSEDDYGRIVRLLILTAQRRDEVGGMRWSELAGYIWTIPTTRTKNHREHQLPLTPAALALLPPQREGREYVFGQGQRGFQGWSKCKARLDAGIAAEGEPLPHWTVHDLRRTAATILADRLGVLPHIVEAILNHVSGHRAGVAGIYNRARYAEEMREALERWTREVLRVVAGRPKSVHLVRAKG
jgi:integrase